jgi:hypothetical protein
MLIQQSQSYRVMKTLGTQKNDDEDDHYYRPKNAVFLD